MSLVKRLFVFALAVTTVLWSLGGLTVKAEGNYGAGSLLALEGQAGAAVYYIGSDGMKYVFPDGKTYNTWYTNFDDVVRVDVAELDLYADGGVVTYRAGTKLVTHMDTAKIYALGPGGLLHWIPDAATAEALYGADWGGMVMDVIPGYFLSSYTDGSDLSDVYPDGTLVMMGADYYYISDGAKRIFASADAFEANNFAYGNALEVTDLSAYADGESITGEETALSGFMPAEGSDDGDDPVSTGSVSISLASDTPASGIGYEGATHVPFTKVNFTAGSDPVTIDSMVLERGGIPASDDAFSGVNMLIDGVLHSSSYKSLNANHQATFTKDLVIPANTTVSATIVGKFVASLDSYSGEMPTLSLASVTTDADVTGTLPVTGNYQLLNHTITIGVLTVSETPNLGTLTEEVGTENVEFLNVKLTNGSDEESLRIDSIRFNNAGSADDADVDNLELVVDGNIIATSAMVSNYVSFDLADCGATCVIEDGQNETFQLRGDIIGGSGRTLDFDIKKADDIMGYDTSNLTYVTPSAAIDSGRTVTISRGTLNVSKTNVVQSGNIPENTNDLELGSWNFKVAGEPITVSTILFDIDVTGTVQAADFTNLKLVDSDGTALTGATDGTGAGDGSVSFSDSFTLPIGDNAVKMVGNLNTDPVQSDTVQFAADFSSTATTNLDATGDITGDAIVIAAHAFPNAEVDANLLTVTDLALTVTSLPQPAAQTIAAGTTDHLYSTIRFDATDSSEDIKVTAFEFYIDTSATAKTNEIQNIIFEVGGTDLSVTKDGGDADAGDDEEISVSLSGDDQFTIPKGSSKNMLIYADISAGATAAGTHKIDITSTNSNVVTSQGATSGNSVDAAEGTALSKVMTVGTAGGTIEVSLDASNPSAALMAGGVEFALAKYKFLATTTEDVELDYLYLTQVVTNTNSSSFEDYEKLWFVDEDGTAVTDVDFAPTSTFPKMNFADDAFVVPYADSNGVVLTLMAKLATIGGVGGGTADHAVGYKINAAADVVAKGNLTGVGSTEYLSSGAAPTGKTHYYYRGYPVVTKDSLSNTLVNGINDLYKFTVTATNDDISLYAFTFGVATTGVTLSDFVLYSVTDGQDVSVTAGTAPLNIWATSGTDWSTNYTSDEVIIGSGTSHTFIMRATVASSGDTGDSVSVHLGGDAAHVAGTDTLMHTATEVDDDTNDDFIWSDRSAGAHTASTDDWTNGFLVSGLVSPSGTSETTGL